MRTGAELVKASNEFTEEYPGTTWRLLLTTLALFAATYAGVILAPWWPVKLLGSVLLGLIIVRLFIFYHDHLHGAALRNSVAGAAIMRVVGYYVLAGWSVWRQTHDYHHKNNAKMLGASIGSYPIVTTDMWKMMTPAQKRDYRLARHPLTIVFGYFTVFILGMCISPFRRAPKQHLDGLLALIFHFSLMGVVAWLGGWQVAFFGMFLPAVISSAAGSYLFYAQHNFPDMKLKNRSEWDYSFAAVRSSSMFDMSPLMHWFTGNIGYHHVHHLNHRIPFYRLPEAMEKMPELQSPGRTTWRPKDVAACLALKVWDPAQGKMVSYEEADEIVAAAAAK